MTDLNVVIEKARDLYREMSYDGTPDPVLWCRTLLDIIRDLEALRDEQKGETGDIEALCDEFRKEDPEGMAQAAQWAKDACYGPANTPPPVLYLQAYGTDEPHEGPADWGDVTWCKDRVFQTDVAYVRADLVGKSYPGQWPGPEHNPDHQG